MDLNTKKLYAYFFDHKKYANLISAANKQKILSDSYSDRHPVNLCDSICTFRPCFQKSKSEIVMNHVETFQPVLDELKLVGKTNLKSKEYYESRLLEEVKVFTASNSLDFTAIQGQDFAPNSPENCPALSRYRSVLVKVRPYDLQKKLDSTNEYYTNESNQQEVFESMTVGRAYISDINNHPDILVLKNSMYANLMCLSDADLPVLQYYSSNFESFTLVSYSPILLTTIGISFYLKCFLSLYAEGNFKKVMTSVISAIQHKRFEAKEFKIKNTKIALPILFINVAYKLYAFLSSFF